MKVVFCSIENGDTLYIVYQNINKDYAIGEAIVTGFTHWTYTVGDRWEDCEEKPMININYEFNGIHFSRNLKYSTNNTHFRDSPEYNEKYEHILYDRFVEVFTTYDEAKQYILNTLNEFIIYQKKHLQEIQEKIDKYQNNYNNFLENEKVNRNNI